MIENKIKMNEIKLLPTSVAVWPFLPGGGVPPALLALTHFKDSVSNILN